MLTTVASIKSQLKPVPTVPPRLGALLRMAWQRVREDIYARVLEDGYDDLNPAHVGLFRYEGLDGRRPTQLAESMQITKQSVNDLLRHMEEKGYLECRTDPADKRARLVRLTARGRKLEEVIRRHAHEAESVLVGELGEEKFRELYGLLLKISSSRTTKD